MATAVRALVEPLHPTHDVSDFECSEAGYLVDELHNYASNAPYVVGQRVLVSAIELQVTGFLAMTDIQFDFADEDESWHCLFVNAMAVSDWRRNSSDAHDLIRYALTCIEPAERATGRDYRVVVIQPESNPDLTEAANRMGFRPLSGGFWVRPVPRLRQ